MHCNHPQPNPQTFRECSLLMAGEGGRGGELEGEGEEQKFRDRFPRGKGGQFGKKKIAKKVTMNAL